jgi:hypothetical protein
MKATTDKQDRIDSFGYNRMLPGCFCSISLTPRFSEVLPVTGDRKTVSTVFRVAEDCSK